MVWKHSYKQALIWEQRTSDSKISHPCLNLDDGWCNVGNKQPSGYTEQMVAAYHNQTLVYAYKAPLNPSLGIARTGPSWVPITWSWIAALPRGAPAQALSSITDTWTSFKNPRRRVILHSTVTRSTWDTGLTADGRAANFLQRFPSKNNMSRWQ